MKTAAPSIPVLVGLTALMPLGMHIVLPAIPTVARSFDASVATIQWSVSLYMIAVAAAQLIYGPLSDRYGRRPPLLVGLGIFIIGSILCAVAPTAPLLFAGRLVQGAGACVGMVLGRAMVRDIYQSDRAVVVLAYISMALMSVPGIAPIVGGLILSWLDWRALFVICVIAGILLFVVALRLAETHHNRVPLPSVIAVLRDFAHLLRLREFVVPAFVMALPNCGFWAFISISPALLQDRLGIPPQQFGFYFAILPTTYFTGSYLSTRVMPHLGPARTALLGTAICAALGVTMLVMTMTLTPTGIGLFLPVGLMNCAIAMTMPALQMRALSADPRLIGAASGLMGFVQMALGATSTLVVSWLYTGTAVPAGAILALSSVTGLLLIWFGRPRS